MGLVGDLGKHLSEFERRGALDLCEVPRSAVVGSRYACVGGALGNDPRCQHLERQEQQRVVEGAGGFPGLGPVEERAPSDLDRETQGWWQTVLNFLQRARKIHEHTHCLPQ